MQCQPFVRGKGLSIIAGLACALPAGKGSQRACQGTLGSATCLFKHEPLSGLDALQQLVDLI